MLPAALPAARADRHAVVLRPVDEVGDDQEVGGEAHLGDDADLVLGLLAPGVVDAGRVALGHALPHGVGEQRVLGVELRRDREARHQVDELEHAGRVDPVGDQQLGVAAALAPDVAVVDRVHLGRGLDVVAGAVELEPVRVRQGLAGLDAQQQVVRHGVALLAVVRVVGDDRRDVQLLRDLDQAVAYPRLDGQAVVHQLEEVVLLAEDVLVLGGRLERFRLLAEPEPGLHVARRAAGGGHQAGGVLRDELLVEPGHLTSQPSAYERLVSLNRLCRPSLLRAQIVLCR